ncbi:MAG: hypothetical protein ACJA2X_001322 [Halocynthiibacter sp.]|jgi:hypothetical protein
MISAAIRAAILGAFLAIPALAQAGTLQPRDLAPVILPSNQEVTFYEVVSDAQGYGLTYRFRFIAPWIRAAREKMSYEQIEADMAFLCVDYALPRIANIGPQPAVVIISMAEREVPYGEAMPDVVQLFEAYRPEENGCIWEGY